MENLVNNLSITSFSAFWKEAKNLGVSRKEAEAFWKGQDNVEVLRGRPISTKNLKIGCKYGVPGCLYIDLMDVTKYSGYNNKVTFLFNVIDAYSRYAWSFPIKNKRPASIVDHMASVISQFKKQHPKNLIVMYADDGNEFKGSVNLLLKKHNIPIFRTTHKQNQALIERFNQTLWKIINFHFFSKNQFRFLDQLPAIINSYNSRVHTSTGLRPDEVFLKGKLSIEGIPVFDLTKEEEDLVKEGDKVRVATERAVFDKGSTSMKWSPHVYEIVGRQGNRYSVRNVSNGNLLDRKYLLREMTRAVGKDIENKPRERLLKENKVKRTIRREPAFQLDEGERRRLTAIPEKRVRKANKRFAD